MPKSHSSNAVFVGEKYLRELFDTYNKLLVKWIAKQYKYTKKTRKKKTSFTSNKNTNKIKMQLILTTVFVYILCFSLSTSFAVPVHEWDYLGTTHVRHCSISDLFQPLGRNFVKVAPASSGFDGWETFEIGRFRMYATYFNDDFLFITANHGGSIILESGEAPTGSMVDLNDRRLFMRESTPQSQFSEADDFSCVKAHPNLSFQKKYSSTSFRICISMWTVEDQNWPIILK